MEDFHRLRKEENSGGDTNNSNQINEDDDDATRIIPKDLLDEIAALHITPKGKAIEDKP